MGKKKKKFSVYILLIVFVAGGYFIYSAYQKKSADDFTKEDVVSDFENKIPAQCENGGWIEFPDYAENDKISDYAENVRIKMPKDQKFSNEDSSIIFSTNKDYSLFFFAERDVRVEGINIGTDKKKEIYVKRIKCVGKEANKETQIQRQSLMKYISDKINLIALQKAQHNDWQVETFYFYNDTDVYVEYESQSSIAEKVPYDRRLWLIRATKMERLIPAIETLAYIQEDAEDWDKNIVKLGEDLYRDADNMTVYEYDEETKKWVLQ